MFLKHKHKIALIISRFNENITELLKTGALNRFQELKFPINDEDIFMVPGAVEIPVVASCLAKNGKYDAVVCLGAIIRGETNHYDYVCSQVSYGCQKVAIKYQLPVIFGILTTDNVDQALSRCGGYHGHKGAECADVALEMIEVLRRCNRTGES